MTATTAPAMNFAFHGPPRAASGRSVGVIGAGPSGLAAAGYLTARGYAVHIYDKLPQAGGLMVFGIPDARIPRERIEDAIVALAERYHVRFHLRTKICGSTPLYCDAGDEFAENLESLGSLVALHDAVLICTGAWKSKRMELPGHELPGICSSLEFLFPIRAVAYDAARIQPRDTEGKAVLVIGGGHSAMDVAHEAIRRKAAKVRVVYRRTRNEAPCGALEVERLETVGGEWLELVAPLAFQGDERVTEVRCRRCQLGPADVSGRHGTTWVDGSELLLPSDLVVTAVGEIPTPPFAHQLGLENVRQGQAHWLQMTAMSGVFVAGDVLIRPSKIGKATYSGLRAARSLHDWLELKLLGREREYDYARDLIGDNTLALRRAP